MDEELVRRYLYTAGLPGPRPDHPHLRRAARQQLPDLAGRLRRVVCHPHLLAGFRQRGTAGGAGGISPSASAASAGSRSRSTACSLGMLRKRYATLRVSALLLASAGVAVGDRRRRLAVCGGRVAGAGPGGGRVRPALPAPRPAPGAASAGGRRCPGPQLAAGFRSGSAGLILAALCLISMTWHLVDFERGAPRSGTDFAVTSAGILYLGWIGSYLISLRRLPDGEWWLLLALPSIWLADSAPTWSAATSAGTASRPVEPQEDLGRLPGRCGRGGGCRGCIVPAVAVAAGPDFGHLARQRVDPGNDGECARTPGRSGREHDQARDRGQGLRDSAARPRRRSRPIGLLAGAASLGILRCLWLSCRARWRSQQGCFAGGSSSGAESIMQQADDLSG